MGTSTVSLVGLLAIWGGLGRTRRWVRVGAVGCLLSLWPLVGAYELLMLFLAQTVVAMGSLMVLRRLRRPIAQPAPDAEAGVGNVRRVGRRFQFTLADLLLAATVAAALLGVGVSLPRAWWPKPLMYELVIGVGFGEATLTAAWIALGSRFRMLRLATIGLMPVLLVIVVWIALGDEFRMLRLATIGLTSVTLVIVVWIGLARTNGRLTSGVARRRSDADPAERPAHPTHRRAARLALMMLTLLIVLPPAVAYYLILTPPAIPAVEMPAANGYADLARADVVLSIAGIGRYGSDVRPDLRPFVRVYGRVLESARLALQRECRHPLQYRTADVDHFELSYLEQGLTLQAELAQLEGRIYDAARCQADIVRLGQAVARGGLLDHRQRGEGIEKTGIGELLELRHQLTPAQARELVRTLHARDAERDPLDVVLTRDNVWHQRVRGWQGRLHHVAVQLVVPGGKRSLMNLHQFDLLERDRQARLRLWLCEVAVEDFSRVLGRLPDDLGQTVPDYLDAVPEDPYSGKPLIYRADGESYLLYSVGENGIDDGGSAQAADGDDLWLEDTAGTPTAPAN